MTIKNEKNGDFYLGTGALDTYGYNFRAFNVESFMIIETVTATGVQTKFTSEGDLDGTVGIVGSGSDYEVNGLRDEDGGDVIRTAGNLPTGTELAILLVPSIVQDTPIRQLGDGHRARLEDEIDRSRQIDLYQQGLLKRSFRLDDSVNPDDFSMNFIPVANKFFQINSANNAIVLVDLGALGAISLPGGNGMAAYTGSNTFISRTITGSNGITVTDGDGQSGAPDISGLTLQNQITTNDADILALQGQVGTLEEDLIGQEQAVPDDTVFTTAGQVNDVEDETASPTSVLADAASAVTFPSVVTDPRIDLLVIDRTTGTWSRVAGAEAPSPVPPAYPKDKWVRCEVTITDTGAVTINTADIRNIKSYLDYSKPQGSIGIAEGTFTSDGNDNRTITTGIPSDATLLEVMVKNLGQSSYSHWDSGDSGNHLNGAGSIGIQANATNRFTISGTDFIVGTLGVNSGATAAGWQVKFRRAAS